MSAAPQPRDSAQQGRDDAPLRPRRARHRPDAPVSPYRIVVIGHGMVAARFLDELDRRIPPGRAAVTVLGEEEHAPYNRLLLTEVVAGRVPLAGTRLPATPRWIDVHRGVAAGRIDRPARLVIDTLGVAHRYDLLVLATGARARPALDGSGVGVHVLRTADDAAALLAYDDRQRGVVVLGGGLLGVEAATGLLGRGHAVTLVHSGGHLLDRQLGAAAGAVLTSAVRARGIATYVGSRADRIDQGEDGRPRAVVLADGTVLPCEVVLATAGIAPRDELAAAAGLAVDRGVVVSTDLRCPDDPAVAAIGDCAAPAGGSTGLLATGWDQADRLAADVAERLGGESAVRAVPGGLGVVRLKAPGLEVVALGEPLPTAPPPPGPAAPEAPGAASARPVAEVAATRVVSLHDPAGGRHVTVAVRDGRLIAAQCVGAGAVAAQLTTAYERGSLLPPDPAYLLLPGATLPGAPAPESSPALMPGSTTVCRCNGVAKSAVVQAALAGAGTAEDVAARTRAGTGCGGCRDVLAGIIDWVRDSEGAAADQPSVAHAAPRATVIGS